MNDRREMRSGDRAGWTYASAAKPVPRQTFDAWIPIRRILLAMAVLGILNYLYHLI